MKEIIQVQYDKINGKRDALHHTVKAVLSLSGSFNAVLQKTSTFTLKGLKSLLA
jgi:hypothetical protein